MIECKNCGIKIKDKTKVCPMCDMVLSACVNLMRRLFVFFEGLQEEANEYQVYVQFHKGPSTPV